MNISTVAITTQYSLRLLIPSFLLLKIFPTEKHSNTAISRLLLRTLHRHQLIEVFVQLRWLAIADWLPSILCVTLLLLLLISLPVLLLQLRPLRRTRCYSLRTWTMPRRIMLIPYISEKMHLLPPRKHRHTKRMDRRIPIPLIVEPTSPVQPLEIRLVRLPLEKLEAADLEIAEELTVIVAHPLVLVNQIANASIRMDILGVRLKKRLRLVPQARKAARVVQDEHVKPVDLVVILHELEDIVLYVAEEMHVRLDAPVVLEGVGDEERVPVEEAGVPAAHVAVGEEVALADADRVQVREAVVVAFLVDPGGVRVRPVRDGDELVVGLAGGEGGGRGFEFGGEGRLAEEDPGVGVGVVPVVLELAHALHYALEFFIADEANQCSFWPC